MTINTTSSVITYSGNGSTTVWSFPFVADQASDLEVIYTDSSGNITTLNPSVYSVTINSVPTGGLWGIGGSVTYPLSGSPIASATTITINRIVPYTQDISINNQGAFYPAAVEQGLDVLELQIQQLETKQGYDLHFPVVDINPITVLPTAEERANGYLAFDSSGNPVVVTSNPPTIPLFTAQTVANIAALRAQGATALSTGKIYYVRGYLNDYDGGEGFFLCVSVSPGADNSGTIIHSNTSGFYFVRQGVNGPLQASWFGAVSGGTYNTAIKACIDAAVALAGSVSTPLLSYSLPKVILPAGNLPITAAITADTVQALNAIIIEGQDTILNISGGVTCFGGVGYDVKFKDVQFIAGACAVSIKSNNIDTNMISFNNCYFINQTVNSVRTDNNSNSTKITFDDRCKFYNTNTAATMLTIVTGDQVIVRGWFETECDVAFDVTDGVLYLDRILGVPLNSGGFWAQLKGVGSVIATECRFGGESGGKTPLNVTTAAAPGYIIFRDNLIFCVGPWIVLGALPKYALVCKGSNAPENTQGIALTSLVTTQKTSLFSEAVGFVDIDPWMTPFSGNQEISNLLFPQPYRDIIQSDVLLSIPINSGSYGVSTSNNHVTVTNTTDAFGNFAYQIAGNNAANDGFWTVNFTTALSSVGGYTGPFTLIADVENTNPPVPVTANIVAGYVQKLPPVMYGKHFLVVHGYSDGVKLGCSLSFFNLLLGATVKVSGLRLIKGHVNPAQEAGTWLSVSANAFPTGGYWFIGDRCKNLPPVSGQPSAWMNTVVGTSGTWKSEGNLS